jgi:hypothetical protein
VAQLLAVAMPETVFATLLLSQVADAEPIAVSLA